MNLQPQLQPRSGQTLEVLCIERISADRREMHVPSEQAALVEKFLRDRCPRPTRFDHIQGSGSGDYLDRVELTEVESAIGSGRYDLVIVEDLSRISRRHRAFDICELCEDVGTRLIAINDSIDTGRDDWRQSALFAGRTHGA